ncbi:MAG: VOC family protein [Gemmatimonadetes bacterium]|nr:VOC family protein [Gemmatimonadota bacterium]
MRGRAADGRKREEKAILTTPARKCRLPGGLLLLALACGGGLACVQAQEGGPPPAESRSRDAARSPELDHVVIGTNDLPAAIGAYERLGFSVLKANAEAGEREIALLQLGSGYVQLIAPGADSTGKPSPFPFEGALAQGWEVEDLDAMLTDLERKGIRFTAPAQGTLGADERQEGATGGEALLRRSFPSDQPVSGTAVYLVDYESGFGEWVEDLARSAKAEAPGLHLNGARRLAYVTVAERNTEQTLKILASWGLVAGPEVEDPRGGHTVKIALGQGAVYLTRPTSSGGIDDFLEERRARAAPVGTRYFEGSILSVGIEVYDLAETEQFFAEKAIPHIALDLPSGKTLVVQGAPAWQLRLEFVGKSDDRGGA